MCTFLVHFLCDKRSKSPSWTFVLRILTLVYFIPLHKKISLCTLQAETRKIYQTLLDEENEFTGLRLAQSMFQSTCTCTIYPIFSELAHVILHKIRGLPLLFCMQPVVCTFAASAYSSPYVLTQYYHVIRRRSERLIRVRS